MRTRKIDIRLYRSIDVVSCDDCDDLSAKATRERARQHAHDRGHTVRVTASDITVYRRSAALTVAG